MLVTYSITFHFTILLKNSRCLYLCFYAGRAVLSSSLKPLIAHCMELLRGPLRPVQRYTPRAFLPIITIQLSKPDLPGMICHRLAKGEASSNKYTSLNSLLLCPWLLLGENKIMYLIFNWRIIVSFFTHCNFVFRHLSTVCEKPLLFFL